MTQHWCIAECVERYFPKVMQNWGTQLLFTIKIQFLADYSQKGTKT